MRLGSRRTIFQDLDCLTAKLYVHSNYFLFYICFYFNSTFPYWRNNTRLNLGDFSGNYGLKFLFLSNRYGGVAYVDERHRHRYEVSHTCMI